MSTPIIQTTKARLAILAAAGATVAALAGTPAQAATPVPEPPSSTELVGLNPQPEPPSLTVGPQFAGPQPEPPTLPGGLQFVGPQPEPPTISGLERLVLPSLPD